MGTLECGVCGKPRNDPTRNWLTIGVCEECAEEQHVRDQEEAGKRLEARQCPECRQMGFVHDADMGIWYCLDCDYETEAYNP